MMIILGFLTSTLFHNKDYYKLGGATSSKSGRDAEMIVTGHSKDGKLLEDYIYYTKDHYESFIRIILD